jgi:aquaporin Z
MRWAAFRAGNPARSTSVAFYADTAAVSQLWLFWHAPLAGAALGALVWKLLLAPDESIANIGGHEPAAA